MLETSLKATCIPKEEDFQTEDISLTAQNYRLAKRALETILISLLLFGMTGPGNRNPQRPI